MATSESTSVRLTDAARNYEPIGDPEHVAYGADFVWTCSCGASSRFATTERKQIVRAQSHTDYCDGETVVDVL